jgi:hypothetical protein
MNMEIEFDPAKDAINIRKHGFSLSIANELDWDLAVSWPDTRFFMMSNACWPFCPCEIGFTTLLLPSAAM